MKMCNTLYSMYLWIEFAHQNMFFFNFHIFDHHIVEVYVFFNDWKMKSIQNWIIVLLKTWKNGVDFRNITYKIYLEPFKLLVWCPFDGPDTKTAQITIEYVHRRQVVGRRPVYVFTKFYYRLFIDELIKCYWRPKQKFSPNSNIFSPYKVICFLTK